jgi:hypothetical protein
MPFTPKPPWPKSPGGPIRSSDWNDLVEEIQRLDTAKFDKAGGAMTGPLTVNANVTTQGLTATGNATVNADLSVGGGLTVHGTGATVRGNFMVEGATALLKQNAMIKSLRVGSLDPSPPPDSLDVAGNTRLGTGGNPIRITSAWSSFPDNKLNGSEISNDTGTYKLLMIIGNKSRNGAQRVVGMWDRLEVNGQACANSFCNLSDGRLKTDVRLIDGALERVSRVRGVSFRWKPPERGTPELGTRPSGSGVGVVAQEIQQVFPELVSSMGAEHHLTVDYSGLTAVLLEAVKALKAANERLEQRVATLEATAQA